MDGFAAPREGLESYICLLLDQRLCWSRIEHECVSRWLQSRDRQAGIRSREGCGQPCERQQTCDCASWRISPSLDASPCDKRSLPLLDQPFGWLSSSPTSKGASSCCAFQHQVQLLVGNGREKKVLGKTLEPLEHPATSKPCGGSTENRDDAGASSTPGFFDLDGNPRSPSRAQRRES